MRRYETIFIVDPDIGEDGRVERFNKAKSVVEKFNGTTLKFEEWGVKKLAYEINKKPRGYYACLDYCGNGELINELERGFRLDDKVMKFMTILLDTNPNIEAIQAEIAAGPAKEEEEAAEEKADETAEEAAETPDAEPETESDEEAN